VSPRKKRILQGLVGLIVLVLLPALLSSGFLVSLGINPLFGIFPKPAMPVVSLTPEPLPGLGITNSILATLLVDVVLLAIVFAGTRKLRAGSPDAWVPTGLQNALEAVLETLYNLGESVLGERTRQLFWLGATIFLFLLIANWSELVPFVESVGFIEEVHGEDVEGYAKSSFLGIPAVVPPEEDEPGEYTLIPLFRVPTTDLNLPLALALISVFMTQVYGVRALGVKGYLARFFPIGSIKKKRWMGLIDIFVGILELISEVAKIISFTFRLFGNLFAGGVLLFVMAFLIPLVFVGGVVFYGLELFVGLIQAFIFMMLTFAFTASATMEHGEH